MLALSSRRVAEAGGRLAPLAAVAASLGFRAAFAHAPPSDAASARSAFDGLGIAIAGVAARPPDGPDALAREAARAVKAAAALSIRLVVVEPWPVPAQATDAARESARAAAVDALARTLHAVLARDEGLSLAIRAPGGADGLLGFREAEWLLSALKSQGLGLWLEPTHAEGGAGERAGHRTLDWADRFGARILGLTIDPAGTGGRLGRPEDLGGDWGTLRESVPSRAVRVLDVGPRAPDADVIDVRRRFEDLLGW